MPILGDAHLFRTMIEILCKRLNGVVYDRVLGIESRGFLLGPLIAQHKSCSFVPLRKRGKLPGQLISAEYELEYGHDVIEVQKDALPSNSKCLIVDDLIATGGTMEAAKKLVQSSGAQIAAFACIIELKALEGRKKIDGYPVEVLFQY